MKKRFYSFIDYLLLRLLPFELMHINHEGQRHMQYDDVISVIWSSLKRIFADVKSSDLSCSNGVQCSDDGENHILFLTIPDHIFMPKQKIEYETSMYAE